MKYTWLWKFLIFWGDKWSISFYPDYESPMLSLEWDNGLSVWHKWQAAKPKQDDIDFRC